MFQLNKEEYEALRFQIEALEKSNINSRSQIVTLKVKQGTNVKYLPYAFTEQGVAMLSGILNSDIAISMNIELL
jgi:ORF6N domain